MFSTILQKFIPTHKPNTSIVPGIYEVRPLASQEWTRASVYYENGQLVVNVIGLVAPVTDFNFEWREAR